MRQPYSNVAYDGFFVWKYFFLSHSITFQSVVQNPSYSKMLIFVLASGRSPFLAEKKKKINWSVFYGIGNPLIWFVYNWSKLLPHIFWHAFAAYEDTVRRHSLLIHDYCNNVHKYLLRNWFHSVKLINWHSSFEKCSILEFSGGNLGDLRLQVLLESWAGSWWDPFQA